MPQIYCLSYSSLNTFNVVILREVPTVTTAKDFMGVIVFFQQVRISVIFYCRFLLTQLGFRFLGPHTALLSLLPLSEGLKNMNTFGTTMRGIRTARGMPANPDIFCHLTGEATGDPAGITDLQLDAESEFYIVLLYLHHLIKLGFYHSKSSHHRWF